MKKNIVIVILAIISLCLAGYIVYDKNNDKEENNEKQINNKIEYTIKETSIIGTINDMHKYQVVPISIADSDGNIKLSYPELNYASNEIKELNNLIRTNVKNNIDKLNNYEAVGEMDACLNIKMNNSNKNITFAHFVYYTYELIENSNYLNILEINNVATTCASGSKVIKEVYIIDKNSKQVINQDKIKESIDNYDNVIEDLLKFIDTQTEDEQIYNNVKNQIDNNNYFVYY